MDHILTRSLLPPISTGVLTRLAQGEPITAVHASIDHAGDFAYQIE